MIDTANKAALVRTAKHLGGAFTYAGVFYGAGWGLFQLDAMEQSFVWWQLPTVLLLIVTGFLSLIALVVVIFLAIDEWT